MISMQIQAVMIIVLCVFAAGYVLGRWKRRDKTITQTDNNGYPIITKFHVNMPVYIVAGKGALISGIIQRIVDIGESTSKWKAYVKIDGSTHVNHDVLVPLDNLVLQPQMLVPEKLLTRTERLRQ